MKHSSNIFTKDFTLVVIGQIISLFGNSVLRFAVPLYLLQQTGSEALFGLVTACSSLPMIILSLLGGVLADRVNKKRIMVILDFSTAALILGFSLLLGKLPMVPLFIVILMCLYGILGAYQPAVQASIPALVPNHLLAGNAVINQVNALDDLLGPVIGGILFGAWGLKPILLISTGCFAASAVMELFIHIPHQRQKRETGIISMIVSDLGESYHFMRYKKPIFMRVLLLAMLFNMSASAMLLVGLPVLITKTLGLSELLYGYSQGFQAAGALAGGILTGIAGKYLKVQNCHRLLLAAACLIFPMGLTLLLSPDVMVSYYILSIAGFFLMAVATMLSIQLLAFAQAETPMLLTGKVLSCIMAVSMCAQPLGQACYGILFQRFQQQTWGILFGTGLFACCIALYSKKTFQDL